MIQFQVVYSKGSKTNIEYFGDVKQARDYAASLSSNYPSVSVSVVVDYWDFGKKIHPQNSGNSN
jgi:hypothetical protein